MTMPTNDSIADDANALIDAVMHRSLDDEDDLRDLIGQMWREHFPHVRTMEYLEHAEVVEYMMRLCDALAGFGAISFTMWAYALKRDPIEWRQELARLAYSDLGGD